MNDSLYVSKTLGVANLVWSDPLGPYNVYRGTRAGASPWLYNHTCFASMVPARNVDDPAMPASGSTLYYLVSRKDPCGESVLGYASSGFPIPNSSPCP